MLEQIDNKKVRENIRVRAEADGHMSRTEVAEAIIEKYNEDEKEISHLTKALGVAVLLVAVSIAANAGTSWYAVQAQKETSTATAPSSAETPNPHMLTDTSGKVLRTDRTRDVLSLTSQLPDETFDELETLRVKGPEGKINFKVLGWARYTERSSRCGSVVVIYTLPGHVQFDGVAMSFDENVRGAFERAGFTVSAPAARRGRRNGQGSYALSGIQEVVGMFNFVAELDTSSLRCGDDIPSVTNNPFENASDVLLTESRLYSCGVTDRPACPSGANLVQFDSTSYYTRSRAMHAKLIDGKWSSYARVTVPEYGAAELIEIQDGNDMSRHVWVQEPDIIEPVHFTASPGECYWRRQFIPETNTSSGTLGFRATAGSGSDYTMRFVGYDVLNGVYVRHYKIKVGGLMEALQSAPNVSVNPGDVDQELDMFEHYDEKRLFSLGLAAPTSYTTFDQIIVDPTDAQLSAAGLVSNGNLAAVNSLDDVSTLVAEATRPCVLSDDSRPLGKVDLAEYIAMTPYTAAAGTADIAEAAALYASNREDSIAASNFYSNHTASVVSNTTSAARQRVRRGGCPTSDTLFRSHFNKYLEDRNGNLGMHSDRGAWQKWTVSDAGGGKFFFTSHRGYQLEDRNGRLGFSSDKGDWQKWTVSDAGGGKHYIRSHRGQQLEDRNGRFGLHGDRGAYQQWYVKLGNGANSCINAISNWNDDVPQIRGYTWNVGPFSLSIQEKCCEGGWARSWELTAAVEACFPGCCGNPYLGVRGQLQGVISEAGSAEVSASITITFTVKFVGITVTFELTFGVGVQVDYEGVQLKMWVAFTLDVKVLSLEPKLTFYWKPPSRIFIEKVPSSAEAEVEVCAFGWICGSIKIPKIGW